MAQRVSPEAEPGISNGNRPLMHDVFAGATLDYINEVAILAHLGKAVAEAYKRRDNGEPLQIVSQWASNGTEINLHQQQTIEMVQGLIEYGGMSPDEVIEQMDTAIQHASGLVYED